MWGCKKELNIAFVFDEFSSRADDSALEFYEWNQLK